MLDWLRRILNSEPVYICETCEVLKEQVAYERYEKEKLLKYILEPKAEMQPASLPDEETEPIRPKIIPWHIRKQMLENEDRKEAELLKRSAEDRKKAIEELEDKLKVNNLVIPKGNENVQSESIEGNDRTDQQEEIENKG